MSKRCVTNGCSKWANQGLLCKDCAKIPEAVRAADVVGRMSDIVTMPAIQTLIATKAASSQYHIQVEPGAKIDLLGPPDNGIVLCRVQGQQLAGYFPRASLMTEEEIYEHFIVDEDLRLLEEIEQEKLARDQAGRDYEAALQARMKNKAASDQAQRAIDAKNRKIEAERMQQELEERRVYEAEEARLRDLSDKQRKAEEAARKAAEEKGRLNEARHNKAVWDGNEAAAKDAAYLASLPGWKRDMVLKKRSEGSGY